MPDTFKTRDLPSIPPLDTIPADIKDHVVVVNGNQKLPQIVDELEIGSRGKPPEIIVVIQDWEAWNANPDWQPNDYSGKIYLRATERGTGGRGGEQDLSFANLKGAMAAIVLADPLQGDLADAHSILAAVAIENQSKEVHTVVELISSINREHLKATQVDAVVCTGELTENLIAQSCFNPGILSVFESLMNTREDTSQLFIIDLPENLRGKTYREIARATIKPPNGGPSPLILCGFLKSHGEGHLQDDIVINPGNRTGDAWKMGYKEGYGRDTLLKEGDRLVVIAYDVGVARGFVGEI